MDQSLLYFINHTLASPVLDAAALMLSSLGLALCPAVATALLLKRRHRPLGWALLAGMAVSLAVTLVFQYLALRARPADVRLIWPAPNFRSFPSGHAAIAFATAAGLSLHRRRWAFALSAIVAASLVSLSRVYLGHHFLSDVAAGAVLGAAIGAAAFGLLASGQRGPAARRWLLWPQLAAVAVVTQMAYLDLLPRQLLILPGIDKVLHFSMFGLAAFWLHHWLAASRLGRAWPSRSVTALAVALPFSLAAIEEYFQQLSPLRTFDLADLGMDLGGMLVFTALSAALLARENRASLERTNHARQNDLAGAD
jgi:undecaprenyl-diphosphatase